MSDVGVAVMALGCLAACRGDDAQAHRMDKILDGRYLVGLAWQPGDGRLEVDATEVIARDASGTTQLSGMCRFIAVAQADAFIVAAHNDDDLALYWVERGGPGVAVKLETAADGTALGQLRLSDANLAQNALLARGAAAREAIEAALDAGVIATAAELLGLIERSLELTLEYLRTRRQFGQAIGAFQALQHRAVDMWIQKELTRAALRSALKVADDPAVAKDARRAAASSVKARASHAALHVCGQAVQLHGAIGFTDEYELGIYVNRALTLAARFGNAALHRRRYGALVPVVER